MTPREKSVQYFTDAPKVNGTFADVLAKFKSMRELGYSMKMIRETFLKDELLALAIWFMDKEENQEKGVHSSDYSEYEEIRS
jgi:hypothetical protein